MRLASVNTSLSLLSVGSSFHIDYALCVNESATQPIISHHMSAYRHNIHSCGKHTVY